MIFGSKSWNKNSNKKLDLAILYSFFVFASVLTYFLRLDLLFSELLFLGLPAAYFLMKNLSHLKKILCLALPLAIVGTIVLDYLAHVNMAWHTDSKIQLRILGVVPVESIIFVFLWVFLTILVYEHFFNKTSTKISKNFQKCLAGLAIITFIFLGGLLTGFFKQKILNYGYLILVATLFFPPFPIAVFKYRNLLMLKRMFYIALTFFLPFLVWEILAVKFGMWSFEGEYIGKITVLGSIFPIEELIFWQILGPVTCVAYYELFINDT